MDSHEFQPATPEDLAAQVCKECGVPQQWHDLPKPTSVVTPGYHENGLSKQRKKELAGVMLVLLGYGIILGAGGD